MFSFINFAVRLIGSEKGFTGHLGAFEFKDGISVEKIHRVQVEILPAIGFQCEAIDDNGEAVFKIEVGSIPAPDSALKEVRKSYVSTYKAESEKPKVATALDKKEDKPTESTELPKEDNNESGQTYSREELEAVADKTGLKGLREIGNDLDIKGKTIPQLIERILASQE